VGENGGGELRLALGFRWRPIGDLVPDRRLIQRVRVTDITFSVSALSLSEIDSLQVCAEGLSEERGTIRLQLPRGSICRFEQVGFENDLDRFHVWSLVHTGLNSQE
jgi:hypothetical protein